MPIDHLDPTGLRPAGKGTPFSFGGRNSSSGSGEVVPGITIKRLVGGLGHQWCSLNTPGYPSHNVGYYAEDRASATGKRGRWFNERTVRRERGGNPNDLDNKNLYYEWEVVRKKSGKSKDGDCCENMGDDVRKSCFNDLVADENANSERNFHIGFNNCRHNSERAISRCCMRKGSLIHSPERGGSSTPTGRSTDDAQGASGYTGK